MENIKPKRVQRKRTPGYKMTTDNPNGCVYVGRPSKWGNFYKVGDPYPYVEETTITPEQAVWLFELLWSGIAVERGCHPDEWLAELRGKDLVCWCPLDQPCHGDVLLRLANAEPADNAQ